MHPFCTLSKAPHGWGGLTSLRVSQCTGKLKCDVTESLISESPRLQCGWMIFLKHFIFLANFLGYLTKLEYLHCHNLKLYEQLHGIVHLTHWVKPCGSPVFLMAVVGYLCLQMGQDIWCILCPSSRRGISTGFTSGMRALSGKFLLCFCLVEPGCFYTISSSHFIPLSYKRLTLVSTYGSFWP